jgi:anti-sigma B factor antagonist
MSNLQIQAGTDGSVASVALTGELDISEAPAVEEKLREMEVHRPPVLVLDLRGLTFLDSSGLRLILEADLRAREDGRRLTLVRGPDPVHRVFLISLLEKRLDFVDDPVQVVPPTGDAPTQTTS